ncbi:hypothetical protein OB919_20810 [Halobacteria archaeon AArc-curdl1]|uniref:Uncharacterized protein n=1 Tax=Natronosalvus hydrolyticus TaxID=2979988 RepID=A0AAP2ZBU7_9EURY|nr:hypothetical protein [Halobacteria archaeon AArc-curdl1]
MAEDRDPYLEKARTELAILQIHFENDHFRKASQQIETTINHCYRYSHKTRRKPEERILLDMAGKLEKMQSVTDRLKHYEDHEKLEGKGMKVAEDLAPMTEGILDGTNSDREASDRLVNELEDEIKRKEDRIEFLEDEVRRSENTVKDLKERVNELERDQSDSN